MSKKVPVGGLSLDAALREFGDKKTRLDWQASIEALKAGGGPTAYLSVAVHDDESRAMQRDISRRRYLMNKCDFERQRYVASFWSLLKSGDLVAYGRRNAPDEELCRIEAAFEYLQPNFMHSMITGPSNLTYYGVLIFRREELALHAKGGGRASVAKIARLIREKDAAWNPTLHPKPLKHLIMREAKERFPGLSNKLFNEVWATSAPDRLKRPGAPRRKPK